MYICTLCQNEKHFKEHNLVETEVLFGDDGAILATSDAFVICEAVICGHCGASSEEGHVLRKPAKKEGGV